MNIILICGASRQKLKVDQSETVGNLMSTVSSLVKIRQDEQTLIYKGSKISNLPNQILTELGISNGDKIMVIGKRYDAEEQKCLKHLKDVGYEAETGLKTYEELQKEATSILNGFIPDDSKVKALKAIQKKTYACSERLMKNLEAMDEMTLSDSFKDAKRQRKVIVDKVQMYLDKCEELLETLENETSRA